MSDDIPTAVLSLLKEHVRSIVQLELLLKLHSQQQRMWSVTEAAKELYTAPSMTVPLLEALCASGLVVRSEDSEPRYAYGPKSAETIAIIDQLSELYQQRRVTIINLIYSAPAKGLQDFADAFRIRKKGNGA